MRAGIAGTPGWKRPVERRRRRRLLTALLALLLVSAGARLLAAPAARLLGALPPFRVDAVQITGLLYLSPEEVRALIPVREGANLLLLRPSEIERAVLAHPRVARARVSRGLGKLRVEVEERRTCLLVNAGSLIEIDASGTILSPVDRGLIPDRPVLSGVPFPTVRPGARVTTARLRDLLRLVSYLEAPEVGLLPEISEIISQEKSRAMLLTSKDQIPITVDPERATLASARALSAALRDLRQRERRVLGVDARYRGQVVVRCAPEDSLGAAGSRGNI